MHYLFLLPGNLSREGHHSRVIPTEWTFPRSACAAWYSGGGVGRTGFPCCLLRMYPLLTRSPNDH